MLNLNKTPHAAVTTMLQHNGCGDSINRGCAARLVGLADGVAACLVEFPPPFAFQESASMGVVMSSETDSPFVGRADGQLSLSELGPVEVLFQTQWGRTWWAVVNLTTGRVVGDDLTESEAVALARRINLCFFETLEQS